MKRQTTARSEYARRNPTVCVRIPRELKETLRALAAKENRTISNWFHTYAMESLDEIVNTAAKRSLKR